jgi:hypothetical protein
MNRLQIVLQHQKRLVLLALMAAAFIGGAGPVDGLAITAPNYLRCVPKHTINSSCVATDYPTIQAAVTASKSGDTILVAAGVYNESVLIDDSGSQSRDGISLLGAQAGKDARAARQEANEESIINASGNSAIVVASSGVVIDGFTVENGSEGDQAGIDVQGVCSSGPCPYVDGPQAGSGAVIVNNIIQKNGTGIALDAEGYGGVIGLLIEHNLIVDNNAPAGDGIFTKVVQQTVITENAFRENKCTAMGINNGSNVTITNNTSEKDGSFVIFTKTTNGTFSGNRGEKFGASGVLPGSGGAAVAVGVGNEYLVIADNWLDEGSNAISNGIAFTNVFGTGNPNTGLYVMNNRISRFPGTGILAGIQGGAGSVGTLDASTIVGNHVEKNGVAGIHILWNGGGMIYANLSNRFYDNEAEGNGSFDCRDDTGGLNPTGTDNFWLHNTGNSSSPRSICASGKGPYSY